LELLFQTHQAIRQRATLAFGVTCCAVRVHHFVDLRKKYHWVLATHQYTDIGDLLASLGDKVIAPAEQKAKELEGR